MCSIHAREHGLTYIYNDLVAMVNKFRLDPNLNTVKQKIIGLSEESFDARPKLNFWIKIYVLVFETDWIKLRCQFCLKCCSRLTPD